MRPTRMLAIGALALALPTALPAQTGAAELAWQKGPLTGDLGAEAQVAVPAGCLFVGPGDVRRFMERTENPPSGRERGAVVCAAGDGNEDMWFVVFSYDPSGYVKDDERNSLDADKILAAMRRGTEAANKIRVQRGWPTMTIEGWQRRPGYDVTTNNLTWAIIGASGAGERTVNHSVRLLGRSGVMSADLVVKPGLYSAALASFAPLVAGFAYKAGSRYAEWRSGDRVASYGLTALVAGGAGAVLVKTGLLAKFWKLIVVGLAAVAAGFRNLFRRKNPATPSAR